ncbi:MAG: MBOAT family protein [Candidatus Omnitrophica bacterium]|nr:MBOAT family protein [Candidatus Omnitrophota bacterium]MBU2043907.1 MBOAT family protein [Candidatus Omnitrophota bacterium]MBU2473830.1 MBOAT family protein [Candidatus Omnitrophota bacterium]
MLLVASYVFYGAWDWRFLSLIWISTILDYICGIKIYESIDFKKRRLFLFLSILGNLSILGFFKYFNFFAANIQKLLGLFGVSVNPNFLNVILPVGISFYTFQTMSYTLDIYRKQMKPTRKLLDFALFVAFFPQLIAGPIERAKNLLPQVLKTRKVTVEKFLEGFRLILWGLFKKVVVADRLGIYVDAVYGNVHHHSNITFILATSFFAFQIYCDFSGYSNMARGLAKVMGFDLMVNFRNPYFAKNIKEFWQRWHISLSSWLKDYLYIPLGGNRKGFLKTNRNIFITMLLGGLWHGANWTFIVWGMLHGIYIVGTKIVQAALEKIIKDKKRNNIISKMLNTLITFIIVSLAWIFFRAENLNDAFYILRSIFSFPEYLFIEGVALGHITYSLMGILVVILVEYRSRNNTTGDVLQFKSMVAQWAVYYLVIFGVIFFGVYGGEQFIYFQF